MITRLADFKGTNAIVYLKMESENITGSMKIRSAKKILDSMNLKAGDTIIESTSGNMGVALAHLSMIRKLNCMLVVDPKLSPWHRIQMQGFGARLIHVEKEDDTGGWLKTRLEKVRNLLVVNPDWHWINQYENPNNPRAFEVVGKEIVEQLDLRKSYTRGNVWFFASVSTGGSLTGTVNGLKDSCPDRRIIVVAVDATGSVIFGGAPKKRYLNGIGSSLSNPPNLDRSLIDLVQVVTDEEAFTECWRLSEHGLHLGGSSGAVISAIKSCQSRIKPADVVIGLIPDCGDIYDDTIYSPSWLAERGFDVRKIRSEACVG